MINGKIYIGQTTKTLEERKRSYHSNYKHKDRPITFAMRKYGFENFLFEIIEDNILDKKILDERERYYIKLYDCLVSSNKGYNVELGGNGTGKHSPETRLKISQAQLGEKNHMYGKKGKDSPSSKPVIELTTGKTYDSAVIAADQLNLNFSHVCATARGTRGSTGGFVFRYLDGNEIIQPEKCVRIKFKEVINNVLPEYKRYISC